MKLFIGFDIREPLQYQVAHYSARRWALTPLQIEPIWLRDLQASGLYTRPTVGMTDVISNAPMATGFAIARFFAPLLAKPEQGLVAFVDCDVMFRRSVSDLFRAHVRGKAVSVVKHNHAPANTVKMDGRRQSVYPRKNWSSVMVFDLSHPKIKALTPGYLNSAKGLDLHSFAWLDDDEIGELPPEWNHLVGHSRCENPALVHWTEGAPCMSGYEDVEYADEFWSTLRRALT